MKNIKYKSQSMAPRKKAPHKKIIMKSFNFNKRQVILIQLTKQCQYKKE